MISLSLADVPAHYQSQSHFMGVPVTRYEDSVTRYAFTRTIFAISALGPYEHPLVLPQFAQR